MSATPKHPTPPDARGAHSLHRLVSRLSDVAIRPRLCKEDGGQARQESAQRRQGRRQCLNLDFVKLYKGLISKLMEKPLNQPAVRLSDPLPRFCSPLSS